MKMTNSAFAANKKQYIQPEVKVESLSLTTILTGSGMNIHTEPTEDQW